MLCQVFGKYNLKKFSPIIIDAKMLMITVFSASLFFFVIYVCIFVWCFFTSLVIKTPMSVILIFYFKIFLVKILGKQLLLGVLHYRLH